MVSNDATVTIGKRTCERGFVLNTLPRKAAVAEDYTFFVAVRT